MANNKDGYRTATVPTCGNLQVGFNHTYGAAYLDYMDNFAISSPGLCGNCDGTNDENVVASNSSQLAQFLLNLAQIADQQ